MAKIYIVEYAPLRNGGKSFARHDLNTCKITSEKSRKEVAEIFKKKCDEANADVYGYCGMSFSVNLLGDWLDSLPSDVY